MKIYTIQDIKVLEVLNKYGKYSIHEDNMHINKEFYRSYIWMRESMNRILNTDYKYRLPIWAWYIYDGNHDIDLLDISGYGEIGEKVVILELEVPRERLVFSCFETWHCILNNGYISNSNDLDSLYKEEEILDKLNDSNKDEIILKSWDNVFKINPVNQLYGSGNFIQATFWEIDCYDIIDIKIIKIK